MIALDTTNNQTLARYDLKTGDKVLKFEIADKGINKLYLSGQRVVGLSLKDNNDPKSQGGFFVWDSQSGKLLINVPFLPGQAAHIVDVSYQIMTVHVDEGENLPAPTLTKKRNTLSKAQNNSNYPRCWRIAISNMESRYP